MVTITPLTIVAGIAGLLVGVAAGALGFSRLSDTDGSGNPLARPARQLDTDADDQAVADAIEELIDAVDTIARSADLPDSVDVSRNDPTTTKASTIAQAVTDRDLVVAPAGEQPAVPETTTATQMDDAATSESTTAHSRMDHISDAGEAVRLSQPPQDRETERLLQYLSEPDTATQDQLEQTLSAVVKTVEDHRRLSDALDRVTTDSIDSVYEVTSVRDTLRDVDSQEARIVRDLCDNYAATLEEVESCRAELDSVVRASDDLVSAAVEQTDLSFSTTESTQERLTDLSNAVDRGEVVLRAETGTTERILTDVERQVRPESSLARDLVDQLGEKRSVDDRTFESTLVRVLETLDETETIRHRLNDVDRETVLASAGGLLDDLDASSHVEGLLKERVAELTETIERANDVDTVVIYAARQELDYYDRTFLPMLRETGDDHSQDAEAERRLSAVENRRSNIRTNYPTSYPEHNHTIPIHFLELVESLHQEAADAETSGDTERAMGLLTAAEHTMDWVEELYDRHAYSVLLKQLRG